MERGIGKGRKKGGGRGIETSREHMEGGEGEKGQRGKKVRSRQAVTFIVSQVCLAKCRLEPRRDSNIINPFYSTCFLIMIFHHLN